MVPGELREGLRNRPLVDEKPAFITSSGIVLESDIFIEINFSLSLIDIKKKTKYLKKINFFWRILS